MVPFRSNFKEAKEKKHNKNTMSSIYVPIYHKHKLHVLNNESQNKNILINNYHPKKNPMAPSFNTKLQSENCSCLIKIRSLERGPKLPLLA